MLHSVISCIRTLQHKSSRVFQSLIESKICITCITHARNLHYEGDEQVYCALLQARVKTTSIGIKLGELYAQQDV